MGKVLNRQVDPVSLLCIFTASLERVRDHISPSSSKSHRTPLGGFGTPVLMSHRGQGVVLPLINFLGGAVHVGGSKNYLEKKSLILQSNWCVLSACAQRFACFSRNYLSLKNLAVLKLQSYSVSCCVDDRVCLYKRGVQWNGAQILKPWLRVGHNKR